MPQATLFYRKLIRAANRPETKAFVVVMIDISFWAGRGVTSCNTASIGIKQTHNFAAGNLGGDLLS
jgi:hypothetical protein